MPGEGGARKCSIWGSILAPFLVQKLTKNGPRSIKSQVDQVFWSQKSGRSGLSVLLVPLVSSGLVVWVVPGGCVQSERRPTAPQELVRGGPRWNDPPYPSRCVNYVSSFSLFCWFCCALLCFASFRFALRCVALL